MVNVVLSMMNGHEPPLPVQWSNNEQMGSAFSEHIVRSFPLGIPFGIPMLREVSAHSSNNEVVDLTGDDSDEVFIADEDAVMPTSSSRRERRGHSLFDQVTIGRPATARVAGSSRGTRAVAAVSLRNGSELSSNRSQLSRRRQQNSSEVTSSTSGRRRSSELLVSLSESESDSEGESERAGERRGYSLFDQVTITHDPVSGIGARLAPRSGQDWFEPPQSVNTEPPNRRQRSTQRTTTNSSSRQRHTASSSQERRVTRQSRRTGNV